MNLQTIINDSIVAGDPVLPELAAQRILRAYGISCPETVLAADREQCLAAGRRIGFPVVIKVQSRQVIHKSDVGGVITAIPDEARLADAHDRLVAAVSAACPQAVIDGVIVQKQMPKGIEVVIGGLRNEQFGPVVMFGLGGIHVEVFKDVAFRLAPLDQGEAMRQIAETKAYKLLQGVRGAKPCDISALCQLLVSTGNILLDISEISEIDFNPVFSYDTGCSVVDARLVLAAQDAIPA